jgi:hypothetical protein
MYEINSSESLKKAILNLEAQRILELELLKKHTDYTLRQLNPMTIAKESIHDTFSTIGETLQSPAFKNKLLKSGLGLATSFLTTKLLINPQAGILKRILGSAVQDVISGFISKKLPDEESETNT